MVTLVTLVTRLQWSFLPEARIADAYQRLVALDGTLKVEQSRLAEKCCAFFDVDVGGGSEELGDNLAEKAARLFEVAQFTRSGGVSSVFLQKVQPVAHARQDRTAQAEDDEFEFYIIVSILVGGRC